MGDVGEVGEMGASRRQTIIILKEMRNITFIHNKERMKFPPRWERGMNGNIIHYHSLALNVQHLL